MPRDLTDLMERATSYAPPEPHTAHEITRLAARRQRRRTTNLAVGLAVALLAVGGLGYGVTRGHDTVPEPAVTYRYGQHQKLSDAVPSASAPGFDTLHYDEPSVFPAAGSNAAYGRYRGIDAEGRLIVQGTDSPSNVLQKVTYQVADGPKGPVRDLPQPSPVAANGPGSAQEWRVAFTGDDQLLWTPSGSSQIDKEGSVKVSDLDGSHVRSLVADVEGIPVHTLAGFGVLQRLWVEDGRAFFSVATKDNGTVKNPVQWESLYSIDVDHPGTITSEEPRQALQIDVANDEAVWVDAAAKQIHAEDLSSGRSRVVPVPVGAGCRIPPATAYFQDTLPLIRTNGDLVALTEYCGQATRIVVTDLSGRLVTQVDPGPKGALYGMALGVRVLTFGSVNGPTRWYADDLETGTLVALGRGNYQDLNDLPSSAGRYVLWYDARGGQVGEFTG